MIIHVQFKNKVSPGFGGRKYSYRTDLGVAVGDVVKVPTSGGTGIAKVTDINVPESSIAPHILPLLKTVTEFAEIQLFDPKAPDPAPEAVQESLPMAPAAATDKSKDLIVIEQLPIIKEQLQDIKEQVQDRIDYVLSLECSEENKQYMKRQRAQLNKEFTQFEERRKGVKAAILAPYEEFEQVYKECVADKYREADITLKKRIEAVESDLKDAKAMEVMDFFNEYRAMLKLDPEFATWEASGVKIDLSTSEKALKEACKSYLDKVAADFAYIDRQDEDKDQIMVEYRKCRNIMTALMAVRERKRQVEEERRRREEAEQANAAAKAAAEAAKAAVEEVAKAAQVPASVSVPIPVQPPAEDQKPKILKVTFTAWGTLEQLKALKQYMTEGGLRYE